MGMYTQLVMACRIKNDPEVVRVLKYLADPGEEEIETPDHEFFGAARWKWLFTMSSYYFVPATVSKFELDSVGRSWSLITCSNLKNYDQEIQKFIDWVSPYFEDADEMVGYYRYEEDREPTIIYSR